MSCPLSPDEFQRRLESYTHVPIRVRVNENRSQLVSVRYDRKGPFVLSIHKSFLGADEDVLQALAQFVVNPTPSSKKVIREFINRIPADNLLNQRRRLQLRSRGKCYDLHAIAKELNETYFEGKLDVSITWGKMGRSVGKRRRHIQLGCYNHHLRLVRIHPILDSPEVPEYFVRFIVYHELLHALLDPEVDDNGRRRLHSPRFRFFEKRFPHYKEAIAFERELMAKL
jgi:hypothetical protein